MNLEQLRQLAERATPGPWRSMSRPDPSVDDHGWRALAGIWGHRWIVAVPSKLIVSLNEGGKANADAIAHAPQDIADLLNALDAAEAQLAQEQVRLDRYWEG